MGILAIKSDLSHSKASRKYNMILIFHTNINEINNY
jgi:hypothetical protein